MRFLYWLTGRIFCLGSKPFAWVGFRMTKKNFPNLKYDRKTGNWEKR